MRQLPPSESMVDWPEPIEWIEFGDGTKAPGHITGRFYAHDGVTIELDIEYANGEHAARRVSLIGDRPIRAGDLRFPLSAIIDHFVAVATHAAAPGGERLGLVQAREPTRQRRRRRVMTDEFIQEVAREWNRTGGDIHALIRRWPASRSQAYRWVDKARAAGLIRGEL